MAFDQDVTYVGKIEYDGEVHVVRVNGSRDIELVKKHLRQLHPDLKIVMLEVADPKDPIGHIEKVAADHIAAHPDQQEIDPAEGARRLNESAAAALERTGGKVPNAQQAAAQAAVRRQVTVNPQPAAPYQPPTPPKPA